MIGKIFNSVFNFMSNPYVVVILTIITDVFMVMEMDGGIHSIGDVVFYAIIMPLILMLVFKCVPYAIAFCLGVAIYLIYLPIGWAILIIRFVFNVK